MVYPLTSSKPPLRFLFSAMAGGKSTIALQDAHNFRRSNMDVLLIKPGEDTKGGSTVISRVNLHSDTDFVVAPQDNLLALIQNVQFHRPHIKHVLVDEAQFLTARQVSELLLVTVDLELPVSCYGLRSNFRTESFEGSRRLWELATEIVEVPTLNPCPLCGEKAVFNARQKDGEFVREGPSIAIDGEDDISYVGLCPHCYIIHVGLSEFATV